MGDENEGGAFLGIEIQQEIHQLAGAGGIEGPGGFVGKEEAGPSDECPDNGNALAFPARELSGPFVHVGSEADAV